MNLKYSPGLYQLCRTQGRHRQIPGNFRQPVGALRYFHRQVYFPVNRAVSIGPAMTRGLCCLGGSDESGNLAAVQQRGIGGNPDSRAAVVIDDQQQSELRLAPFVPGFSGRCICLDLPAQRFGTGFGRLAAGLGKTLQRPEDRGRAVPVLPGLAKLETIASAGHRHQCARSRTNTAL